MIILTAQTKAALQERDPARLALVEKMTRYLNNLEGSIESGSLDRDLDVLKTQERFLAARLEAL